MLQNRRDVDELVKELAGLAPIGRSWFDGMVARAQALVNEPEPPEYAKYREAARNHRLVSEGTLEVDDNAIVSDGDDPGAYVEAWLWIPYESAGIETQEEEA